MGNNSSSTGSTSGAGNGSSSSGGGTGGGGQQRPFQPFQRRTGSLGLSRAELDKRCKPSGLYDSCTWEDKTIRRLIADGKLSARQAGTEERSHPTHQECPICFLHYSQINSFTCCHANICTECYLQVASDVKGGGEQRCCPFCNCDKMGVVVANDLNVEEVRKREEEEQRVIEATIRARNTRSKSIDGQPGDIATSTAAATATATAPVNIPTSTNVGINDDDDYNSDHPSLLSSTTSNTEAEETDTTFGSSLTRNLQSRYPDSPNTNNDSNNPFLSNSPRNEPSLLSPEQRANIEREMRSQTSHPLYQQFQQQEEDTRTLHELQHVERTRNRMINARMERALNLLGMAEGMDVSVARAGGGMGGGGLSLLSADGRSDRMRRRMRLLEDDYSEEDDEEEEVTLDGFPRRRPVSRSGRGRRGLGSSRSNPVNEMFWVEAALLLSMQENADAQHRANAERERNASGTGDGSNGETPSQSPNDSNHSIHGIEEGGHPLDTTRRASRNNRIRRSTRRAGRASPSSSASTAANVLLGSMTEEEQLAIAVALSLREAENAENRRAQEAERGDNENEGSERSDARTGGDNVEAQPPTEIEEAENNTTAEDRIVIDTENTSRPQQEVVEEGNQSVELDTAQSTNEDAEPAMRS